MIQKFCEGAKYYLVKFDNESGKILDNKELNTLDLSKNEIHRSTQNHDDSMLFVYTVKPIMSEEKYVLNPVQLLLQSLDEARAIEAVYPHIFNWVFDGVHLKAQSLIPSNDTKSHTTITRYGGTTNFYKVLIQHLSNIGKMKRGQSPDYDFTSLNVNVPEMELAIGSINKKTGLYSSNIKLNESYKDILIKSQKPQKNFKTLNILNMKYWAREINPDFITEAKHMKLENPIEYVEEMHKIYPLPIKRLMKLKHKGNYNRYLLSRFLLNVHSPKDAKFVYYSVLANEELEHVKNGNCSTQWNYIRNNISKYDCPNLSEMRAFIKTGDKPLVHLLEPLQDFIDKQKEEKKE